MITAVKQMLDGAPDIDVDEPLMSAGVSSMMAVELTTMLEGIFNMQLPGECHAQRK